MDSEGRSYTFNRPLNDQITEITNFGPVYISPGRVSTVVKGYINWDEIAVVVHIVNLNFNGVLASYFMDINRAGAYISYLGPMRGYLTDPNLFNKVSVGIYLPNIIGNRSAAMLLGQAQNSESLQLRDYLELSYDVPLQSGPYPKI